MTPRGFKTVGEIRENRAERKSYVRAIVGIILGLVAISFLGTFILLPSKELLYQTIFRTLSYHDIIGWAMGGLSFILVCISLVLFRPQSKKIKQHLIIFVQCIGLGILFHGAAVNLLLYINAKGADKHVIQQTYRIVNIRHQRSASLFRRRFLFPSFCEITALCEENPNKTFYFQFPPDTTFDKEQTICVTTQEGALGWPVIQTITQF